MIELSAGQTLAGDYEIIRDVKGGFSGMVYEAQLLRPRFGLSERSPVAIKLYNQHVLPLNNQRKRIEREASLLAGLDHPNLVKTYELQEATINGNARPFLAMEWIDGSNLEEVLAGGRIDSRHYFEFAVQLLSAVQTLHKLRIVHRDIKPANIMLRKKGDYRWGWDLKLADFGVAKPQTEPTLTPSDEFLGTIRNAAPEYLFNGKVTTAIDMYSIGSVLYHMSRARPLFAKARRFAQLIVKKSGQRSEAGEDGHQDDMQQELERPVRLDAPQHGYGQAYHEYEVNVALTLVAVLMADQPEARPTAPEALELLREHRFSHRIHPFTFEVLPRSYWKTIKKYTRTPTPARRLGVLLPKGVSRTTLAKRHTSSLEVPDIELAVLKVLAYWEPDVETKRLLMNWLWDLATPDETVGDDD